MQWAKSRLPDFVKIWISEEELEPFCRLRSQYQHTGPVRSQQPRVPFPAVDGKTARGQG